MANEQDIEDLAQPKKEELAPDDLESVVGGGAGKLKDGIVFTGGSEVDG